MVSAIDLSKRALVTLLNSLANVYAVVLGITRESPDGDVHRAYRKLSKKCHPDKGGKRGHQQSLNAAFDTWEGAKRAAKDKATQKARDTAQRQQERGPEGAAIVVTRGRNFTKEFRFRGAACLLTYQSFGEQGVWQRFLSFVQEQLSVWKVRFWCATLETNRSGSFHLHLMVQFYTSGEIPPLFGDWRRPLEL